MFFNVVKATILISAVDFVTSAATSQHESVAAVKRHYRPGPGGDCKLPNEECGQYANGVHAGSDGYGAHQTDVHYNSGAAPYGGVTANHGAAAFGGADVSSVSAGFQAMVRGWASLTPAFTQFQSKVSSGASIDVAIQAATALGAQVQSVSSHHASCGCSPSSQTSSEFQSMAVQFLTNMQSVLQVSHQTYGYAWESRFKSVFQQYSSAFESLKAIAASIHFDLAAAFQLAHVNVKLFATVGLNLSVLFQSSLSVGGLLDDKLPFMKQ